MLAEALILMAAAAPNLDAFDDANLAITTCGFAAYRQANEQDQSLDQFRRTLSANCSMQIADMRRAMIAVGIGRGESREAAAAAADSTIAQFHARFASHYAKRAETEAQLRALERALREEGKSNAQ